MGTTAGADRELKQRDPGPTQGYPAGGATQIAATAAGSASERDALLTLFAGARAAAAPGVGALLVTGGAAGLLALPPFAPLAFTACALAAHSLSAALARHVSGTPAPALRPRREVAFALLDLVAALAWSGLVAALLWSGAAGSTPLALTLALVYLAGMSVLSAPLPPARLAATLPALVSAALVADPARGPAGFALPALLVLAALALTTLARHAGGFMLGALTARGETAGLIEALEQAKARSDEAASRAEAASVAKSRFLAQMSHELRTPLNAILGFSEVMKSELLGRHSNPTYREYAGDIHASGKHLLNLIDEILDISRIESGRYELNEEPVALADMVEDCRQLLKIRARTRGIRIHELYEPGLPALRADERALRRICLNLLSNAVKFAPLRGEVWVKVGWTASGGQYLSVRDSGPGIPSEQRDLVLASFGRGDAGVRNAEEGAGLGLPIVKGLAELHGGALHLRNRPDHGTEFIVTFPASRVLLAHGPAQAPAPAAAVPEDEAVPAPGRAAAR
ncbi:sensor histidine kinase [Ancylobacter lacus]|uniref:sensor histidine kinase n=1 Tax=Ancylobacter lacus TaxID=2579970 RepID=UPI001BCCA5E1|nr:HAMP domain-containing sensor histidine kinase [Ancylobacter lacus]MBS7541284.1 HAMP domain-containing histidine kinase [Ancylobacter lacus]